MDTRQMLAAREPLTCTAEDWDNRLRKALAKTPHGFRTRIEWLLEPSRRWIRIPAGFLFVLGGLLSVLPVLGLWMLPLGLALWSEDYPPLKIRLEKAARWGERQWARLRR